MLDPRPDEIGLTQRLMLGLLCCLVLLWASASAHADTIKITHVHPVPASGALGVTVTASGPLDSVIALDLFDQGPTPPSSTGFIPRVDPQDQPIPA